MSKRGSYQETAFWESRYKQNICEWYEWLATPNQLAPLVQTYLPNPSKILELGCGSSNFAQKLMTLHHESVTCLDFSKEIIRFKSKHAKEGVSYKAHDISQPLPFDDDSFDAIIEKNTLDCLFCFEDFPGRVMKVMKECYRVLKEGGIMLSFSHGKEKVRRFFYRNRFSPFNLKIVPVGDLKPTQAQVYMYVLIKGDAGEILNKQEEENDAIEEAENEEKNVVEEEEAGNQNEEENEEEKEEKKEEEKQEEKDENEDNPPEEKQEEEQQNYEFDEVDEVDDGQ